MKAFNIGISSWTFGWAVGVNGFQKPAVPVTPLDLAGKCVSLKADVLQIADNLPLHTYDTLYIDKLGRFAADKGIALEVGTKGLGRDNLLEYLAIAKRLGAKLVRTLPHDTNSRPDLNEARAMIREVLPEFRKNGIILGIENHDFYPSEWLRDLVTFFSDPCLGVCLDTVNNFGQGESEKEVFDILGKYAVNFHCKDYIISRKPHMMGFDVTGAPTGEGFLNLKRAAKLPGNISWIIELWTPWQGNVEDTVQKEAKWAENSVINLRNFRSQLCL